MAIRAIDHSDMTVERIVGLTRTYSLINPAAAQRQARAKANQNPVESKQGGVRRCRGFGGNGTGARHGR